MTIQENIEKIKNNIPSEVTILAATKTRSKEEIIQAIESGIKIMGENYVQEAEEKKKFIDSKAELHCIGHLQKNKIKKAVGIFDMIQTLDSEKISDEIDKACSEHHNSMPILIEVNIAEESNKKGCLPSKVAELAEHIRHCENLELKGIMTIGPNKKAEALRPFFKKAKEIYDSLSDKYSDVDTLSMGMSDSYEVAIEEGATMIRIGNAIFGKRR